MKGSLKSLLPIGPLVALAFGLSSSPSCQPAFPTEIGNLSLEVTITAGSIGAPDNRVPITYTTPDVYTVNVEALDQYGNLNPTFNGYVRCSVQPGTVVSATSADPSTPTNGRNVQLVKGVANNVQVAVVGAYGDARIWVEDLGYEPVNPLGVPLPDGDVRLPQCSNGIDDNHNGLTDYPVDPGCYAPNDDTEDGGTYAGAATEFIHFVYPRIADVEGYQNGGAGTPFPNEQVQIDTQWNGTTANTPQGVVVNGVGAQGFYATDVGDKRPGADTSIYAYTYSAPALMNVCDRLMNFGGTSSMFYGFLEINYPTWSLEEWDPTARPCLVPEPTSITVDDLASTATATTTLIPLEASLVRVPPADGSTIHVGKLLGPHLMACTMVNGAPSCPLPQDITADATNCDFEGTGKIDYTAGTLDDACASACQANVECSEYTNYISEQQFQLVLSGKNKEGQLANVAIQANGSMSAGFDPILMLGTYLKAFTGTLNFFSGGSQFTIQARCADDIVPLDGTILPSSPPWPTPNGAEPAPAACVVLRSVASQTSSN